MDKISVAVIGATGAVGQRFIQLLDGHPFFSVDVVAASGRSAGNKYGEIVNWGLTETMPGYVTDQTIEQIEPNVLKTAGIELVFSALPAEIAKDVEPLLAENGYKIFSNASAFRMAENVPLLIADINPEHLGLVETQKAIKPGHGYIVTNPNCSVSGLATALKPIATKFGIKDVNVTTYQALSGAGYPGVPSLDIVGNVVPFIPDEEVKVEEECQKILGRLHNDNIEPLDFDMIASCARVPVRDGHLEAVIVNLERGVSVEEMKNAFLNYNGLENNEVPTAPNKPIIVTEAENRPQPTLDLYSGEPERAAGMAVTVGRIKKYNNKFRFYLLVHNTIRGAAGCSIMNAELAKVKGYL